MRRFVVTSYTVKQLRGRLSAHNIRTLQRMSEEEIKDIVDRAVSRGMNSGLVQSFENADGRGLMVDITEDLGCELWAFTRPDRAKGSGELTGKTAVVTVMDHAFVDRLKVLGGLGKVTVQDAKEIAAAPLEDTEPRLISYYNKDHRPCTAECLAKD